MSDAPKENGARASPKMGDINVVISAMICHKEPVRKKEEKTQRKSGECHLYI